LHSSVISTARTSWLFASITRWTLRQMRRLSAPCFLTFYSPSPSIFSPRAVNSQVQRPATGLVNPPCAAAAATSRVEQATRTTHRLVLEVEALRAMGVTTHKGLAQALMERGVSTPRGGTWSHTTVARVPERLGA
jgi:hypothetical protein